MYGGRDETVSLICENRLIGVILDRFSTNVMIIPEGSSHFMEVRRLLYNRKKYKDDL